MTDLYKILDVNKTAGKGAIKKAYRDKAKTAHPDKGGSAQKFGTLQKAYDILSDDERRAKYDATGDMDEKTPENPLTPIVNILTAIFNTVLQECAQSQQNPLEIDICNRIRMKLDQGIAEMEKQIRINKNILETDKKLQGRFKKKKPEDMNIFESIGTQRLRDMQLNINNLEQGIKHIREAMKMVLGYDFKSDAPAMRNFGNIHIMNTIHFGGF